MTNESGELLSPDSGVLERFEFHCGLSYSPASVGGRKVSLDQTLIISPLKFVFT